MSEKVRENKLRRMASRRGLRLVKSGRRDPDALDFNKWMIVDSETNGLVAGANHGWACFDLDDVEQWLAGGEAKPTEAKAKRQQAKGKSK